jgi:hypothetical protein
MGQKKYNKKLGLVGSGETQVFLCFSADQETF